MRCENLAATVAAYEREGFVVDSVFPADNPRVVVVSRGGERLRLEATAVPARGDGWVTGRAGMEYRDLIPDRAAGRVVASHIRILEGGPVPDYVHFHRIAFQMIYCAKGWVRVVYEDQGAPFVMSAGDCVLQPPKIRHRVLESSRGLEVVEISAPAEHETLADHELALPTDVRAPDRDFDGQRFVLHKALNDGPRDFGFADATRGLASASVVRDADVVPRGSEGVTFVFVLSGSAGVFADGTPPRVLAVGDAAIVAQGQRVSFEGAALRVGLHADLLGP